MRALRLALVASGLALAVTSQAQDQAQQWTLPSGGLLNGSKAVIENKPCCEPSHGAAVVSATHAPDLRRSPVPFSADAFRAVVHDGVLRENGMAAFDELTPAELEDVRHYIRTATHDARTAQKAGQ